MPAVTAWSFHRYDTYAKCALSFKFKFIDKLPTSSTAAMEAGNVAHKTLADYLTAAADAPVPEAAGKQAALVAELRGFSNKVVERQWAYTREWHATTWFAKNVWVRVILDVGVLYDDMSAECIDWKNGKQRDDHTEQMELFALAMFKQVPKINHVTTRLAYLTDGGTELAEFAKAEEPALQAKWEARAITMLNDTAHKPRPGQHCRWCDFSKERGGPCVYS
jgi:RecB family exonuclease